MVPWTILILFSDIALFALLAQSRSLTIALVVLIVAIALGCVGIFFRIRAKVKQGKLERMHIELDELKKENKELLERIAGLREREILSKTNEDLV